MTRSTLIGLVVLGLVAAGVFWVRSPSPSVEHLPTASARQASDDEALPDVTLADASVDDGNVRMTLSLDPKPPVAFGTIRVRVSAFALSPSTSASAEVSADRLQSLEGGRIAFEMAMPMGDHRYSLVAGADGWQEAEVVLPSCPSGKRRWYATVRGTVAGQLRSARFRFDLAPRR